MKNIKILDCTLRDGGYVNSFAFSNTQIQQMTSFLNSANIDIIECGFLDTVNGKNENSTRFSSIDVLNKILSKADTKDSLHVAMLEYGKYDTATLPVCTKDDMAKINGIRFSFRKSDHNAIFDDIKTIIDKGYKLFIQPIATETYSDTELIDFIHKCNQYDPFAFYIVDTHGSMHRDDLRRLYYLLDHNLSPDIMIGFHSHNNLQLSYSNAIDLIEINKFTSRNIIIDASVFGMGRGAGNLNTELLAGYLNDYLNADYDIENLLEIMDKYLLSLRQKHTWGYSLEHYLSAVLNCHPNYASFLINQKNLDITEIKQLLCHIPAQERREYNKNIIDDIYIKHKESVNLSVNLPDFDLSKNIILIGSGASIKEYKANEKTELLLDKSIKIALNHPNKYIDYDYVFFTNQVRYNEFCEDLEGKKIIVTSNIKIKSKHLGSYVLDYKQLFEYNDIKVDNVALLMLNYLGSIGFKEAGLMGIDGFSTTNSYSYDEGHRIVDASSINDLNNTLAQAYRTLSQNFHLQFLTPSLFEKHVKQKIIGVIPARISSTRLPGKPLADILGIPMVIHVMKRAMMSDILDEVIVATDSVEIFNVVTKYNGKAIMTSADHLDGTARMQEVSTKINGDIFVLVNGDEPLVTPINIEQSVSGLINSPAASASLLITKYSERNNTTNLKVVINNNDEIMYISRSDIPSDAREELKPMWKAFYIVSYRKSFLDKFVLELKETELNSRETTDQNKILEYGYKIQAVRTESSAISVDTQDDLEHVREKMKKDEIYLSYKDQCD